MSSDEGLQDAGVLDIPESLAKKKKSFHPLRSLKKLFGHGNGSSSGSKSTIRSGSSQRRRSHHDDDSSSSVLLKSRSTTDVIVVSKEPTENDGSFQVSMKHMSMSADSIFPAEKVSSDSSLPVLVMSSEAVLHSENDGGNVEQQNKDDDEGLPQSPFTLATSTEVFFENELKKQPEKWPSFDSAHSLLSVDSYDNDTEEDFFKENWMMISKSDDGQTEAEATADNVPDQDVDLNLVVRHSNLSSVAAVHKLAVRPKGKRMSSVFLSKVCASSVKLQESLPLVKEECSSSMKSSESEFLTAESEAEVSDTKSPQNDDLSSTIVEKEASKNSSVDIPDKDLESTDKQEEILGATTTENYDMTKESEEPGQDELDPEAATKKTEKISVSPPIVELSDIPKVASSTELIDAPKVDESRAMVKVRQKPPRVALPSADEFRERAAKRQTVDFSGEPEIGALKPISKRSSMVLLDNSVVPQECGDSELAKMFSRFQRRASEKQSNLKKENTSKSAEFSESGNGDDKVEGSDIPSSSNPEVIPKVLPAKDALSSSRALKASTRSSGRLAESSVTRVAVGGRNETGGISEEKRKSVEEHLNASEGNIWNKTGLNINKENVDTGKNAERKVGNAEMIVDKNKEKASQKSNEQKCRSSDVTQMKGRSNKSSETQAGEISAALSAKSADKAEAVKKSVSISYKALSSSSENVQPNSGANPKMRSASQSENTDIKRQETSAKLTSSQAIRRGSLSTALNDTQPKPVRAFPYLESSSMESSKTAVPSVGGGNDKANGTKHNLTSGLSSTQLSSSSGSVPFVSGSVFRCSGSAPLKSKMVSSGSGNGCSGSGLASSGSGSVPSGSGSVLQAAWFGVMKPPGCVETTSKSLDIQPDAPDETIPLGHPPNGKTSFGNGKVSSSSSEKSHPSKAEYSRSASADAANVLKDTTTVTSATKDPSQLLTKTASVVRPAGGQKALPGKIVPERESVVEWADIAHRKKLAWKEGKVSIVEYQTATK